MYYLFPRQVSVVHHLTLGQALVEVEEQDLEVPELAQPHLLESHHYHLIRHQNPEALPLVFALLPQAFLSHHSLVASPQTTHQFAYPAQPLFLGYQSLGHQADLPKASDPAKTHLSAGQLFHLVVDLSVDYLMEPLNFDHQ